MEIIKVENLSFWYGEENKPALKNINLSIKEGEFVLIVGLSGCGKSTLIRTFNKIIPDYYGGKIKGRVYFKGEDLRTIKKEKLIENIGMVYQHPEKQVVMQDVEREIAFGLENLDRDLNTMKRNVSEVISLLGVDKIRDKSTGEISGGEKQRVAIGSVVAMDPEVIIFDEPISQLDPISSEEVLNSIKKINRDMGKTVILVEQRLDKTFDMADRIIFMKDGEIVGEGTPHNIPDNIKEKYFMPNLSYVFKNAGYNNFPVNVKEGREIVSSCNVEKLKDVDLEELTIKKLFGHKEKSNIIKRFFKKENNPNEFLKVHKVNFGYEKTSSLLKNINFALDRGEILTVMGENGAGKSTIFKIISGIIDKYEGKVIIDGEDLKDIQTKDRVKKIGYLSQNPNDYFGRETVFEEISYTLKNIGEFSEEKVESVIQELDLEHLKHKNPRDLSGGEKQRTAIACTMVTNPDMLILDEPTRGMDTVAKEKLGEIIKDFARKDKAVVLITHDADFAGEYSDRVMLMFNGEIVALGNTRDILYNSIYYSPQLSKVFKSYCRVIKNSEAMEILKVIK